MPAWLRSILTVHVSGHRFDLAAFRRTDVLPVQGQTDMAIAVDEAEHAAFGVVAQLAGEAGESFAVEACVVGFVDQNRVVTPDYSFFSDHFGKFSECLDPLFDRGKVALDVFPVRVQRELEIILEAVQLAEPRQHRSGVLRPKDDAIHCVRTEAHAADRPRIERIGNEYVSFPEAVKEPRGVEGGNVRPTAGADDHTI